MKKKSILVINGHPDSESYCSALTKSYINGAISNGSHIENLNLRDLNFNPNLKFGYRKRTQLEPDLQNAIDKIKSSDHIVWVFPMWWFGYPAIMKGFIERVFLPGIMFEDKEGKALPKKLLKGKTGRIIITADTPRWYDKVIMRSPAIRQFKKGTLQFCGISPVKVTYISPLKQSSDTFRKSWLNKIYNLGIKNS